MSNEQPRRLRLPSPDARVARTPFPDELDIPGAETAVRFVPIVQWSSIRIRGRIDSDSGVLGFEFARPARQGIPGAETEAFVYTVDQPAIDGTAWADGVEFSLEITASEHQGENWLKITLDPDGGGGVEVDFFDISGVLLGTYH